MSDEQQIAVLREEIRRAGRWTCRLRVALVIAVPLMIFTALAVSLPSSEKRQRLSDLRAVGDSEAGRRFADDGAAMAAAFGFIFALVSTAILTPATSLLVAAGYRRLRRARLRRKLSTLEPGQLAELLTPLRDEPVGDARKLALSLLRSFSLPTDLIPAAAPDARGDEPAPT